MDETPIWFEMVSLTTITKIGEKCIKKGGKKEIDIEKNIYVQKRKIYILRKIAGLIQKYFIIG